MVSFNRKKFYWMFSLLAFPLLIWAQEGQGDDSLENFAHGVGDSIISIKDLFAAQDDGGQNLMRLIRLVIIVLNVVILAVIAFTVIRRMLYNRSFKKYYVQLEKYLDEAHLFSEAPEWDKLIDDCVILGRTIDRHTHRKHNAVVVAALTYRIAQELEVPKEQAIVYLLAAMVYDAGFLDLDADLFRVEILSAREKKNLTRHVMQFPDYLPSCAEDIQAVFAQACMFHHENEDGSGYLESLTSQDIPLLAKIIHVTESYSSLISERTYHHKLSPQKAIEDLRKKKKFYDAGVIDILSSIV
ncbi:MAG: hypothetical protein J6S91_00960 [Treponema sp.]|nr:hypothetical protein [Treponema sp.]